MICEFCRLGDRDGDDGEAGVEWLPPRPRRLGDVERELAPLRRPFEVEAIGCLSFVGEAAVVRIDGRRKGCILVGGAN